MPVNILMKFEMKQPFILALLILAFASCKTVKKVATIQEAITKKRYYANGDDHRCAGTDSASIVRGIMDKVRKTRIDFNLRFQCQD